MAEDQMKTLDDIPHDQIRSPLPLWVTPWFLRIFGYPMWRFLHAGAWIYVTDDQYFDLFDRRPVVLPLFFHH